MRITLVIPSLTSGGAERVAATMADHWAAEGRDVTLVTIEPFSADFYPVDARIRRVSLAMEVPATGKLDVLRWAWRVVRAMRRAIVDSRPDVVLSFMDVTNVLTLVATIGLRVPVMISEHTDPREHRVSPVWRLGRALGYRRARALVVMTEAVGEWARRTLHAATYVIPNPVIPPSTAPASSVLGFEVPPRTVAAMGRLSREKGFDQLIRAMARCAPEHPDWRLLILGEGHEREALTGLARELGIGDRVLLPGRVLEPTAVLRQAQLFVVPSRYEGFSCALAEAMACGLPVVSMDCPSGPGEIVRHGTDGLLVEPGDVEGLAQAMSRLMDDPVARRRLGARAPEVLRRFGVARVMSMWDRLLGELVPAAARSGG